MTHQHYIIRGGVAGRERLRIVGRVMRPSTLSLLERVGLQPGMSCLDLGCGGGDVTCEMARLVGTHGRVMGADIDAAKIALAQEEAQARQLGQIEFRLSDALAGEPEPVFDLVYARFLLTHLPDPLAALRQMVRNTRPGGVVVVEDID
jgi:ubiquinone/menaquinone biosynthesis C-methylase UbiE